MILEEISHIYTGNKPHIEPMIKSFVYSAFIFAIVLVLTLFWKRTITKCPIDELLAGFLLD